MSVPVLTFFNNKGGVGKTSLIYHVAWMLSDMGLSVLTADLDPQGNLSAAFLDDEELEKLWPENGSSRTIFGAIEPLRRGVGDIKTPETQKISDTLFLVPGDMALSGFEDDLSQVWPECLDSKERAFRVISAFWRVIQEAAERQKAKIVLVDIGPNLGAINRAALISSSHVVVPLAPDLFSLQGLRNLGPTLRKWRKEWGERLKKNPDPQLQLPQGEMSPIGYIVMQHSIRQDRPAKSYEKWIHRMPGAYRKYVLEEIEGDYTVSEDPHCFGLLKHYRSLMAMAQEARKPMFLLKPADGAIGSHALAAQDAREDFKNMANKIVNKMGISIS